MKPRPFKVFSCPQANPPQSFAKASPDDGRHWAYMMEIGKDEHSFAEHERRALLMTHAPELLHELRVALEILLQVLDHQRDGKPLPLQTAVRHVAMDAINVIDLAEGRKTEGTRFYPPPDNV